MLWMVLALVLAPQADFARDALNIGRTHDQALYDAFHSGYTLTPSGDVDSIEIITEFRRAVLIVRQHANSGEYSFGANDLAAELAPYRGLLTIVAQVRLNPLNTYLQPPSYDLYVRSGPASKPIAPTAFKREGVYPVGMMPPGVPIVGVRLEGTFARADIASASDPYIVIVDDKGALLWQGRLDVARYR